MRKLVLVALASSLIFQVPVSAQAPAQSQTQADLATGIRQVEEGDLEAAVITLDAVIQRLKQAKGQERDLATAHLYLSMAHLGLSQWERAKAEMREAWANNKDLTLDPKKYPPRVIQLHDDTKREARKAEAEAAKARSRPSPAPTPVAAAQAPSKKGGSKTTLILLGVGVAATAGGVAIAVRPEPSPTPTPPVEQRVVSTGFSFTAPGNPSFFLQNFTVAAAGSLRITLRWTRTSDNLDLYLLNAAGTTLASNTSSAATDQGTASLTAAVSSAGSFAVRVIYASGSGSESGTLDVFYTPSR